MISELTELTEWRESARARCSLLLPRENQNKVASCETYTPETLKFPTIDHREVDIVEAYADTCSILDSQSTTEMIPTKPSPFLSWLKNDQTFFWISGKAGCGKSTLMKYVYQNGKTKEALSQWAHGKELVLAGYFFFDRGDEMQKSREGMLRGILYQVLSTRRNLITTVFAKFFEAAWPPPTLVCRNTRTTWRILEDY